MIIITVDPTDLNTPGTSDFGQITDSNNPLVAFTSDPSTHRQCFEVDITDDAVLEDTEGFSLNLSLAEEPTFPVLIVPDSSQVEIEDQNGKSKLPLTCYYITT